MDGDRARLEAPGQPRVAQHLRRLDQLPQQLVELAQAAHELALEELARAPVWSDAAKGVLGGLWLEGHGLSVGSEALGCFSGVRRAASSLQMQSEKPVVASYGLTKTATLTMLAHSSHASAKLLPEAHACTAGTSTATSGTSASRK